MAAYLPLKSPRQATKSAEGAHEAFECTPGPDVADSHPFSGCPRAAGWHRRPAHAWLGMGTRAGHTATTCARRRPPYLPGVAGAVGNQITRGAV